MKNKGLKEQFGLDGIDFKPIFIVISILCIAITLLIDYNTPIHFKKVLRLSMLGVIFGLIIENYRITKNWRHVVYLFIGTYVLSLSWFLINKDKNVEKYICFWPYYFMVIFLFVSISIYSDRIIKKLTEGITLIFSLAFLYWLIEKGIFNFNGFWEILVSIFSIVFLLFSIVHSLFTFPLSKTNKLLLSVWTTIILLVMSLENVYDSLKFDYQNNLGFTIENSLILLKFFLLGISGLYVAQNINLIFILLDGKSRGKAKRIHISRYLDVQVLKEDAIFCILFSLLVYVINFYFKILPFNYAIWVTIFLFPYLLELKRKYSKK